MDSHIVPGYATINAVFGSRRALDDASIDEILPALEVCHAFAEQLRFHLGGMQTLEREFKAAVNGTRLRRSLNYLLRGEEDFVTRMGAVIYEEQYRIPKCGRAVVQELLGWVNNQNVPICNGRTLKSIRFLGFNVRPD
jgi:hypothetical protein